MSKNKIIALILAGLILIFFGWVFSATKNGSKKNEKPAVAEISIWQYGHSQGALNNLISKYKEDYKVDDTFKVTTFTSYGDYKEALKIALLNGNGPDLFTLNNSDDNAQFENAIMGVDPSVIPVSELKDNFEPVFSRDLIQEFDMGDGKSADFIVGVPLSYDYLVMYSNLKYTKSTDISKWAGINEIITKLSENGNSIVPIAVGNGSTVKRSADIFTQMLVNKGADNIISIDQTDLKNTGVEYHFYGDKKRENAYDKKKALMELRKSDSLKLFAQNQAGMTFGLIKDLSDLIDYKVNTGLLKITNFPSYVGNDSNKVLIDYNYFVINKDSENVKNLYNLFGYMLSEEGQREYMANSKYNLPGRLSILEERLAEKLDPKVKTRYSDIYPEGLSLTSFNTVSREEYNKLVEKALDSTKIENELSKMRSVLSCRYAQTVKQTNLTNSCN